MLQKFLEQIEPRQRMITLVASFILALGLFAYTLEASFRDDGRIVAPNAALFAPLLCILAGVLVFRFPKIAIVLYAIAAVLLFLEWTTYRGYLIGGAAALMLGAVVLQDSTRTKPAPPATPVHGNGK